MEGIEKKHKGMEMIKMEKQSVLKRYLRSVIALVLTVVLAVPTSSINVFANYSNDANDSTPQTKNPGGSESGPGVVGDGVFRYKISVAYTGKGLFNGNEDKVLDETTSDIGKADNATQKLFKLTSGGLVPLYTSKTPIGLVYKSTGQIYLPKDIKMIKGLTDKYNADLKELANSLDKNNLANLGGFGIGSIYFTGKESDYDSKHSCWFNTNFELGLTASKDGTIKYTKTDAMKGRKIDDVSKIKKAAESAYEVWVDNYGDDAKVSNKSKDEYLKTFFSKGSVKFSDGTKVNHISSTNKSLDNAIYDAFTMTSNGTKFDKNELMVNLSGLSGEKRAFYSARNTLVTMTLLKLMMSSYKGDMSKEDEGVQHNQVYKALYTWYKDYATRQNQYELAFIVEPFTYLRNCSSNGKTSAIITPNSYLAGWLKEDSAEFQNFPVENKNINYFLNTHADTSGKYARPNNRDISYGKCALQSYEPHIDYTMKSGYSSKIIGCLTDNIGSEYKDKFINNNDIQTDLKSRYSKLAIGNVSEFFDTKSYNSPIDHSSARAIISKLTYTGWTDNRGSKQLIRDQGDKHVQYSYARMGWGLLHTSDFINLSNTGTSAEMYTSTISLLSRDTKTIGSEYLGNTEDTGYADKAKATIDSVSNALQVLLPVMKSAFNNSDASIKYRVVNCLLNDIQKDGELSEEFSYEENGTTVTKKWSDVLSETSISSLKDLDAVDDKQKLIAVSRIVMLAQAKSKGIDIIAEAEKDGVEVPEGLDKIINANLSALTIDKLVNGNTITVQSEILRVINDVGEDLGVYSFLAKLITTIETDILCGGEISSDAKVKSSNGTTTGDIESIRVNITNTEGTIYNNKSKNNISYYKNGEYHQKSNNTVRDAKSALDKLASGKSLTKEELKELTKNLEKEDKADKDGYNKIYVSNMKSSTSNGFITKKNKLIIRNTLSNAGNSSLVGLLLRNKDNTIKVDTNSFGSINLDIYYKEKENNEETNADKLGMSSLVMSSSNVKFKLIGAYNNSLIFNRNSIQDAGGDASSYNIGDAYDFTEGKNYRLEKRGVTKKDKSQFKEAITDKKGGISAEMSELQELISDYINDCNDFYLWYFRDKNKMATKEEFNKLCKKELQMRLANYLDIILDNRNIDKETAISDRLTTNLLDINLKDIKDINELVYSKSDDDNIRRLQCALQSKLMTNWSHFDQYKLSINEDNISSIGTEPSSNRTDENNKGTVDDNKNSNNTDDNTDDYKDAKTKGTEVSERYGLNVKDVGYIVADGSDFSKFIISNYEVLDNSSTIKYNYVNDDDYHKFGKIPEDKDHTVQYMNIGLPINNIEVKSDAKNTGFKFILGSGSMHSNIGKVDLTQESKGNIRIVYERLKEKNRKKAVGRKDLNKYKIAEIGNLKNLKYYQNKLNWGSRVDSIENSFLGTRMAESTIGDYTKHIDDYIQSLFGDMVGDTENNLLTDFIKINENSSDYNSGDTLTIDAKKIQEIILKCVCIASLTKSETSVLVDVSELSNYTDYISYIPASMCNIIDFELSSDGTVSDTKMSAELASSTDGTIELKDLEYVNAAQLSTSLVEDESLITGLFEYGDLNGSTQQLISGTRIWNSTIYGANAPVAQLTIEINSDKDGAPKEERDVKEWLQEKRKSMTDPNGNLFKYLIENQDIKVTYVKDAYTVPVGISSGDMLVNNESTSLDKLVAVSVLPFNKENAYTTEATGNTYVGEDDLSNMLKTYTEIKDTVNKKGELVNGENAIKYKFNGVEQKQMNSTVVDCIEPETKMSLCVSNFEAKNKQVPTIVTIKIQKQSADRINVFLEKTSSSPSPQTTEQPKYKVGDVEVGKVTVREGKDKTTDSGETKFPTTVENRVEGPKYSRWVYKGNDADADRKKVDDTQYKLVYWGVVDGNHITNTTDKSKQTWAKTIRDKAETLKNKETFINENLKSKDWINKSATDRSNDNGYEKIQISSSDGYATYGDTIVCIYEPLNDDPLRDAEVEGDFTLHDDEVSRYYGESMRLSWKNIRMDLVPYSFSWNANTLKNNANGTYKNGEFDSKDESFHGSNNTKTIHGDYSIPAKDHIDEYKYETGDAFIWKISNNIDTYKNDKVDNKNHVFGLKAERHTTYGSTFEIKQEQKQNGAIIKDAETDTKEADTVNGAKEQLYSMYVTRMSNNRTNTTDNLNVPSYKYNKDIEINNSSITIKKQNVRKTSDNQRKESYNVDLGYNIANINPTDNLIKDYKFLFSCSGYYIGKGAVTCDGCYSDGVCTCNQGYTSINTKTCDNQTTKTIGSISKKNQKVGLQKISDDNAHVNGTEGYKNDRDRSLNNSLRLRIEVYEAAKKLNGDTKNGTGGFETESGETINNVNSTVLKYKDNISFYPYVKMQSSNNIGKSEKYYAILGDHRREIPRLDTIEIGWSKVDGNADDITADSNPTGYDSEHNLQITSKQWSTHSRSLRAFEDENTKNKVLPGGAVYQLSTGVVNKGSGDNKVKQDNSTQAVRVGVRTYNYFIPSGDYTTVNNDKEINGSDKDMEKLNTIPYNRSNVMTELKDAFNGSDWNAYSSGLSKSSAETKASNTIKGILRGLSQTEVQQIAATGRRTEAELLDATSDKEKYNRLYKTNNTIRAIDKSARKVFDRNLSELDKYWLNKSKTYKDMGDEIDRDSANSASLDVTNLKKTQYIYTVRSTVMGSVIVEAYKHNGSGYVYQGKLTMDKGTTDVGAGKIKTANGANATKLKDNIKEMNASCKLITNYISAIQRGEGQGHELLKMKNKKKVGTGEYTSGWYNEAFDGISVLVSEYVMDLGFYNGNDGEETSLGNIKNGTKKTSIRSTALNVNLVGTQENKSDLYNFDELSLEEKVRTSMFITKPYIGSARNKYEEIASIGTKGSIEMSDKQWNLIESDGATAFPLKLNDMAKMYHSRTFYIPNATVMDLN